MDNLRSVLSIVLSKIPSREILSDHIQYNSITKDDFVKIFGYYVKNYSNDELENMFSYVCNDYEQETAYVRGYEVTPSHREESFSIFDAILIFAVRVLQEENGEPVCKYENILRWRMLTHELGEDIFTTAFLAYRDERYTNVRRDFSWRPVIRHNNSYLNKILSQGMADNHFHLKGSAPQFPLSWISMMNCVTSRRFRELLDSYSKKRLSTIYYIGSDEEHLYIAYLKAALIRCFLFAKLTGNVFSFKRFTSSGEDREEVTGNILDRSADESWSEEMVRYLLQERDAILFYRGELQNNITYFRAEKRNYSGTLDYALNGTYFHGDIEKEVNGILSGERWFMYAMFQKIIAKDSEFRGYFNLFYAYLVIKSTIRAELVQTNSNIGFDNFAKYQDRKEDFVEDTAFEKHYLRMALKGTITNQNILCLEARISPKNTAEKNRDYIQKIETLFDGEEKLKERFFYVFHFIKEKDDTQMFSSDILCRHYKKRIALRRQATAIARFRERYPKQAVRLRGIDACAKEIGCRPEVFAQTYRYLRNHMVYPEYDKTGLGTETARRPGIDQLSLTYHIGEDYLDILDGLRAVDEAVFFLGLDCGSRIGHALALGVDVEEYYEMKRNKILISQQDYLDNIVWLYYRIKKFDIRGFDELLIFLEQEYNKYFRLIYGNFICDDFFYSMIKAAREYFRRENEIVVEGYCNSHFSFAMSEYYAAWKLRGDRPECYINGYFREPDDMSEWDRYAVNRRYPRDYRSRYNPECAYLYYLYHYCSGAKLEGRKIIEKDVSHQMVQCLKLVQEGMRRWIGKLGIGIETNPSSNYLIGIFKRYDKHPIFEFYNLGLTMSPEELERCPQIPVCVNTDDQGIFATYLENEYALLALALEKAKDKDGKNKYNRMMIYQWIDGVRQLGLHLSFAKSDAYLKEEKDEEGKRTDEKKDILSFAQGRKI